MIYFLAKVWGSLTKSAVDGYKAGRFPVPVRSQDDLLDDKLKDMLGPGSSLVTVIKWLRDKEPSMSLKDAHSRVLRLREEVVGHAYSDPTRVSRR